MIPNPPEQWLGSPVAEGLGDPSAGGFGTLFPGLGKVVEEIERRLATKDRTNPGNAKISKAGILALTPTG